MKQTPRNYIYALKVQEFKASPSSTYCGSGLFTFLNKPFMCAKTLVCAPVCGSTAAVLNVIYILSGGSYIMCGGYLQDAARRSVAATKTSIKDGWGRSFESASTIPASALTEVTAQLIKLTDSQTPMRQQMDANDAEAAKSLIYIVDGRSPDEIIKAGGIKYDHSNGGKGVYFDDVENAVTFALGTCSWNPKGRFSATQGWNLREKWSESAPAPTDSGYQRLRD